MTEQPATLHLEAVRGQHEQMSRGMWQDFAGDLAISGALPWLIVVVLQRFHVPLVTALTLSTIVPFGRVIFSVARDRRLDAIGLINVGFLLGSIAVTFLTGDAHIMMLKGAVVTATFSLVCLGSLLAPRPLMFYLGRQFSTHNDPILVAQWNKRWHYAPPFRAGLRLITAVWGIGYMLEVVARVIVAFTLPKMTAITVAPIITYGMLGILMAGTISYSGAMRRKYAAQIEKHESATPDHVTEATSVSSP